MSLPISGQQIVTTYSSPADVTNVLNITFTASTVPNSTQVSDLIVRGDAFIDQATGHNWRTQQVVEQHDSIGTGIRAGTIIVRNRPVISIDRAEYWDGGTQTWIAGANTFPEQSPNLQTYYVYLPEGKIVWSKLRLDSRLHYRVTYTWGYKSPPDFIRDLSSTIAARDILTFWGSQLGIQEDITVFKKRLDEKINRLIARAAQRPAAAIG